MLQKVEIVKPEGIDPSMLYIILTPVELFILKFLNFE